jgi:hypothetical protein
MAVGVPPATYKVPFVCTTLAMKAYSKFLQGVAEVSPHTIVSRPMKKKN